MLFSREFHQWHDDIGHHHSMGTWHGRASTNKRNPGKFPTFYPFGIHLYIGSDWLVVDLPLWKIWKSNGIMTFPIYGKIKNVPNLTCWFTHLVIFPRKLRQLDVLFTTNIDLSTSNHKGEITISWLLSRLKPSCFVWICHMSWYVYRTPMKYEFKTQFRQHKPIQNPWFWWWYPGFHWRNLGSLIL